MLEFPGSEVIKPYKVKATYIIAYINLLGGLGIVTGEQMMIIPLAITHCLISFMKHNPFQYNSVADQATYDNKLRKWLANMFILFAVKFFETWGLLVIVHFINVLFYLLNFILNLFFTIII